MSERVAVGCAQPDCPVLEDGRCLEGLGEECPHVRWSDEVEAQEGDAATAEDAEDEPGSELLHPSEEGEGPAEPDTGEEEHIELGGGDSITLSQAEELAQAHSAYVVLIAGEFRSGKTTLVAEIYGRFLRGPYRSWSFAGSQTLYALDRRYHRTREKSGLDKPDMPRTPDEEMRVLDLRLISQQRRLSLMFSDVRGELFDNISQGAPVESEVPLAARANAVVVLLNGFKLRDWADRGEALNLFRQLIAGLAEDGGVPVGTPLAIVLSKRDLLADEDLEWFERHETKLRELAARVGYGPVAVFPLAACPEEPPHEPDGLDPLFDWLCEPRQEAISLDSSGDLADPRSFWRWGAA
jgi:hypothetical protein